MELSASCTSDNSTPNDPSDDVTFAYTNGGNLDVTYNETIYCTFTNTLQNGTLTLVKEVNNLGESGDGYLGPNDFGLTIDDISTTSGTPVTVSFGDHTIAETAQTGYTVGTWSCTDGTTGTAGATSATVNIYGGENTTCTMINTLIAAPALTIVKTADPLTYDEVGDVIGYSYLVTNSGNVTLFNITVVDDKATVTCPDTSLGLAPLGTITCTASYTIDQEIWISVQ